MIVSIVIPAYNAAKYLGQTIDSVLGQSFIHWSMVIVDDGSADDTAAVACAYAARDPRLRVIRRANGGHAAARNSGFAATDPASEYVVFLDADDVREDRALEILVNSLDEHPEAVATNALARIIDSRGEPCEPGEMERRGRHRQGVAGKRVVWWPVELPTTLAVLAYGNCIYTPGQALIRRSELAAVGPFDPDLSPGDDWDMWLRLSARGDIALVDRVLLNWRRHDNNTSRQLELVRQKHLHVRLKLLSSPTLSAEQRRVVFTANRLWGREACSARLRAARGSLAHRQLGRAVRQARYAVGSYVRCLRGLPAT